MTVVSNEVRAPWTPDQVASLNSRQLSAAHPYTCGSDAHEPDMALYARADGWRCIVPGCGYVQHWAHARDADWTWRGTAPVPGTTARDRIITESLRYQVEILAATLDLVRQEITGLCDRPFIPHPSMITTALYPSADRIEALITERRQRHAAQREVTAGEPS